MQYRPFNGDKNQILFILTLKLISEIEQRISQIKHSHFLVQS